MKEALSKIWSGLVAALTWLLTVIHPNAIMARFGVSSGSDEESEEENEENEAPKPQLDVDLGEARVVVPGIRTTLGGRMLAYAHDLAGMLNIKVKVLWGARDCDLRDHQYNPGDILVSRHAIRPDVHTVFPFDETGLLDRQGMKPAVLIPIGNDESPRYILKHGLPFIKRLGFRVVLWHTTWRNPTNPSTCPKSHLSVKARVVIPQCEKLVRDAGVECKTVVETAPSIPYGIVKAAIDMQCPLIMMALGMGAGRGSYVYQVLEKSPVPVMVLGRSKTRRSRNRQARLGTTTKSCKEVSS